MFLWNVKDRVVELISDSFFVCVNIVHVKIYYSLRVAVYSHTQIPRYFYFISIVFPIYETPGQNI